MAEVTTTNRRHLSTDSADGQIFGQDASDLIGFYGATPVARRADASQTAFTDNSTGTATDTIAAGAGVTTLSFPIQLAAMTTSAADLVTNYTPGYKFKILAVDFVTTTLGAGAGATQTVNMEIGTTNLTGGVMTITLASTDTLGEISAGTAVTAANTGSSTDTISIEVAASGTVFTAGAGIILVKIQNMDTADFVATVADKWNEIRTVLGSTSGVGLMKDSA